MRDLFVVLLVATILPGPFAWAETVYKCKSPEGGVFYQATPCASEVESISSWASKSGANGEDGSDSSSSSAALVIGQSRNGGYFVDGAINDQYLNFVVDTGATLLTLPLTIAASAGLRCQKQAMMHTGNGTVMACSTTVRELKFGPFTVRNVDALIAPNLSQPLLGMNVLRQFRVEQDGGEMRLSKKY